MIAMTGPLAVRVFPGQASQAAEARHWVRGLASPAGALACEDAALAVTELFANAVRHTRSGDAGGTVTVAVTADGVIHVHDLGTTGQPGCPVLATAAPGGLRLLEVSGRGLPIVAALCPERESRPAAECPAAGPGDPAALAGGCCIACRPQSWPGQVPGRRPLEAPAGRVPGETTREGAR
jgi:anti-sigma regulatory factor (Ser/Thr protein kinase)